MTGPNSQPPIDEPDAVQQEPIYRAILWVLVFSVVAGVGLALSGELLLGSNQVRNAGTGIGLVSGFIYFAFRWLGRREQARRRQGVKDRRDPGR